MLDPFLFGVLVLARLFFFLGGRIGIGIGASAGSAFVWGLIGVGFGVGSEVVF